jgi:nucleoside 2-deoxyribosyltransferase
MKAYLAAPIFTPEQLDVVDALEHNLLAESFEVFSPYAASQQIWKGRAPKDCTPAERQQVLNGNVINLMRPTRLLVAWVGGTDDGRVDTGVAWEMGFFHNRCIRGDYYNTSDIASLAYIDRSDKRQHMNLMLAGTVTGVALGLDEFRSALRAFKLGGARILADQFHPDRRIAHERDPIV